MRSLLPLYRDPTLHWYDDFQEWLGGTRETRTPPAAVPSVDEALDELAEIDPLPSDAAAAALRDRCGDAGLPRDARPRQRARGSLAVARPAREPLARRERNRRSAARTPRRRRACSGSSTARAPQNASAWWDRPDRDRRHPRPDLRYDGHVPAPVLGAAGERCRASQARSRHSRPNSKPRKSTSIRPQVHRAGELGDMHALVLVRYDGDSGAGRAARRAAATTRS